MEENKHFQYCHVCSYLKKHCIAHNWSNDMTYITIKIGMHFMRASKPLFFIKSMPLNRLNNVLHDKLFASLSSHYFYCTAFHVPNPERCRQE